MAKATRVKVKISGNTIEAWEFTDKPCFLEGNSQGGRRKKDAPESEKADEYRKDNSRRSKAEFRSLVSANFKDGDKFVTLTFRDTDKFDIRSVPDTNKQFDNFIKRLRYYLKKKGKKEDFKYIRIIEFQDENKRGAVHFHFIADLPFIPHDDLAKVWKLGFVGINRIEGVDNIGAYISKYMAKDQGDPRLKGKKNYTTSEGLEKPLVLYGSEAQKILNQLKKTKKEVFTDCYESEHFGNINYLEYNKKRDVKQTKIGKGLKEKLKAEEQVQQFFDMKYKNTVGLADQADQLLEDLQNGKVTFDKGVLEQVQRREKKSSGSGHNIQLSKKFLESVQGRGEDPEETYLAKQEWQAFINRVEVKQEREWNRTFVKTIKKKDLAN